MVTPISFAAYVVNHGRSKRILARVYLNCLYECSGYPVDLSEMNALSAVDQCMVFGLLDTLYSDPTLEHIHDRDESANCEVNDWLNCMRSIVVGDPEEAIATLREIWFRAGFPWRHS